MGAGILVKSLAAQGVEYIFGIRRAKGRQGIRRSELGDLDNVVLEVGVEKEERIEETNVIDSKEGQNS